MDNPTHVWALIGSMFALVSSLVGVLIWAFRRLVNAFLGGLQQTNKKLGEIGTAVSELKSNSARQTDAIILELRAMHPQPGVRGPLRRFDHGNG